MTSAEEPKQIEAPAESFVEEKLSVEEKPSVEEKSSVDDEWEDVMSSDSSGEPEEGTSDIMKKLDELKTIAGTK